MAKKVYAVKKGRTPGIYYTWADCQKQTSGYSGAVFKSFSTVDEAKAYLADEANRKLPEGEGQQSMIAVAYVDGSYDKSSKRFASGVVFFWKGEELHFSEAFEDPDLAEMRNVAGEIRAAQIAMQYSVDHQIPMLRIYHDYEGIAKWCTGEWQAKKEGTRDYRAFYQSLKDQLQVEFVKVKGHSGDQYNDLADALAKAALGKIENKQ